MMKRVLTIFLVLAICLSLYPMGTASASNKLVSRVSRDDGTWLFPVAKKYYNSFTDWAGCPGNGVCGFCGTKHSSWGDSAHTWQAPMGHNGIDIGVTKVAVYAAADGTVAYINSDNSRGKYIILEHQIGSSGYSYYSYYQHLESCSVKKGNTVSAGDKIAISGNTGQGTGYHLHFGIVMAKSGAIDGNRLNKIESKGWITAAGNKTGRILNNPSASSQRPTGGSAVVPPLAAHCGSVAYTFNKNEVNIAGGLTIKLTAYPSGTLTQGSNFTVEGTVTSNYTITSVKAEILNSATGEIEGNYTGEGSTTSFSFADSLNIYALLPGTYTLNCEAVDASGEKATWSGTFSVESNPEISFEQAVEPSEYPDSQTWDTGDEEAWATVISFPSWRHDENGWWVEYSNGTYLVNQWYQSPSSGLWYYLGADGYMLTNAITPDGWFVNADGVWVQ